MRRLVLATLLAVASTLLVAPAAQAATYSVSIALSTAKADVGQVVKISGTVKGTKSSAKALSVQRKVGSGAWTRLGTVKTGSTGKYSYAHKVTTAGTQYFRVIAPTYGSVKQGVSASKTFTGWAWLWLAQQPHFSGPARSFWDADATVAGTARPHSVISLDEARVADWSVGRRCDRGDFTLAVSDAATNLGWTEIAFDGPLGDSWYSYPGAGDPRKLGLKIEGAITLSFIQRSSESARLVGARVHCNVPRLPAYSD